MLKLGVLDQSPLRKGGTTADALRETIELVKLTDKLGYERYWVAEHHSTDTFAGSAPEVLIPRLAAESKRIRVGSGGVMLMHYSPYKVAEAFNLMETLYPNRIDLGIGRAPGGTPLASMALAYGNQIDIEYFPTKLKDLIAFLYGTEHATEQLSQLKATPLPAENTQPELWLLGSSEQSAVFAAYFGMGYSYAWFISPEALEKSLEIYRAQFKPAPYLEKPKVSIGVFAICAETEEEANRLAGGRDLWRLRFLKNGQPGPYPSDEEVAAYEFTEQDQAMIAQGRRQVFTGTPGKVKTELEAFAAKYDADELVILTICYDFEARKRSYELLAEAFSESMAT
ncbi:MAG: LLM class flavin-dependent oxidoreductase [Pseudomonadota bacterium]